MDNYRIPKLEEFVQGFEFEVAHDFTYGFLDVSNDKPSVLSHSRIWIPRKVTWKTDKMSEIWDCPFNVESFLEQELIRVKIL